MIANRVIPILTIIKRSLRRTIRLWTDYFIPPIFTSLLVLFVFGDIVGSLTKDISHISYLNFIVPGLILTVICYSSYSNVLTAFVQLKLQSNIEVLLSSPLPHWQIALGYIIGGCCQGFITAFILIFFIKLFIHIPIAHIYILIFLTILIVLIFACIGFLNSLWVKKYDNVFLLQGMIITPLIYLGGPFYPFNAIPKTALPYFMMNPVVYLVDLYRYAFFGYHELSLLLSAIISLLIAIILLSVCIILANYRIGLTQK